MSISLTNRHLSRRSFLKRAGAAGAGLASAGLLTARPAAAAVLPVTSPEEQKALLTVLATASAATATLYAQIILSPLYQQRLSGKMLPAAYLGQGFREEVSHYQQWVGQGAQVAQLTFYYPQGTAEGTANPEPILQTLLALEELAGLACAAGTARFSESGHRSLAARLLSAEGQHQARVQMLAAELGVILPANSNRAGFSQPSHTITALTEQLARYVTAGASGFSKTGHAFRTSLPPDVLLISLPMA